MCGQAGAFSTTALAQYELDKVKRLLVANSFRGTDSTGAMWWFKNPPKDREAYGYIKRHEHPFAFCAVTMEKKIEGELFKPMLPNLFSVHCRAATVGNVEKKNAHPFAVDHVIGMHNGSITTDFTNKKQFDTDSEALYHNIATMGVDAAIKDLPFSAAYALVWLDRKKNTLNFLRNAQRPLFVVHQGITLYWSSLEEDLIWGLKLDPPKVETKTSQGIIKNIPLFFKPNVLYSIPLNESGEIRWETKDIEPRSYIHHANTRGYNGQGSFFPPQKTNSTKSTGTNTTGTKPIAIASWAYTAINWRYIYTGDDKNPDPLSEFKKFGYYIRPVRTQHDTTRYYYAIELDQWLPIVPFLTLALWRYTHREQFRKILNDTWAGHSKLYEPNALACSGLSKNALKRLLRGRLPEFFTKPFLVDTEANQIIYIKFSKEHYQQAMKAAKDTETDISNVIILPNKSEEIPFETEDEPEDSTTYDMEDIIDEVEEQGEPIGEKEVDGTILYAYGANHCTDKDDLKRILADGCAWCSDPMEFIDIKEAFFISGEEFLCPSCQNKVMTGEIQADVIPRWQVLPAFVQYRLKLEEVQNNPKAVAVH